jgi:antirestriction factor ArdC-like protein
MMFLFLWQKEDRTHLSPSSNKEQRFRDVEAKLTAAVESITNEETFRKYLDVQARFHTYSARNVALLMGQRPDATKVAGVHAWNELGRFVNKGERGPDIYAPVFAKGTKKEDEERETPVAYIPVKVFDISQTNGAPLPEFSVPELHGEEGAKYYAPMVLGALDNDFLVFEEDDIGQSTMGLYRPADRTIIVGRSQEGRPRSGLQRLKTLAHEFAHGLNDHGGPKDFSTNEERETVAEGSAYVALQHLGVDSSERSFPYIAAFAKDVNLLKRVMSTIQTTSRTIIAATEAHLPQEHAHPEPIRHPNSFSAPDAFTHNIHRFYGLAGGSGPAVRLTPRA